MRPLGLGYRSSAGRSSVLGICRVKLVNSSVLSVPDLLAGSFTAQLEFVGMSVSKKTGRPQSLL